MPLDNRTCFIVNLRDRLSCIICGKVPTAKETYHRGFEYHHVLPRSEGGADAAGNVVLLCHDCHSTWHLQRHGKKEQAALTPAAMIERFSCKVCEHSLNPQTVEMNCGWYRCDACHEQTHLFTHFYE